MHKFLGLPVSKKQILLLVVDAFLLLVAYYLAFIIRLHAFESASLTGILDKYTGASFFAVFSYLISFYVLDLYNPRVGQNGQKDTFQLLLATMIGAMLVTGFYFFFPPWRQGRTVLLLNSGFAFLFGLGWRKIYSAVLYKQGGKEPTLIIGAGWAADSLLQEINDKSPNHPYEVVGMIDDDPEKRNRQIQGYNVIGTCDDIARLVREHGISTLVMAITHERHKDLLGAVLIQKMTGVRVEDMRNAYKRLAGKIPVYHLEDDWLIDERGFETIYRPYIQHIHRLADVLISSVGLILTSWLLVLVSLAIKLTSRGPVFYRQKRMGLYGEVFNLVKFRSMVHNAEAGTGAVWSGENDSRITFIGRLLRRTRIDEIPQFLNVLWGDMSLIGPRPERPEFVSELAKEIPYYYLRHTVKPGLTGWAQVNYRYGASKEDAVEKLQYDLYYIQEASLLLDLVILLKTLTTLILRRGS